MLGVDWQMLQGMDQSVLLVAPGGLDPTGVHRGEICFLKCLFVDIDTSLAV